jgi:beta-glucosidase/6-phospho-beta-glucosidase/beta-galactosidase
MLVTPLLINFSLKDMGGFLNPYFVKYFQLYAKTLYAEFGSKVKMWITFNEPYESCVEGYSGGTSPPLIKLRGTGEYICAHNVLLAHAAAYDTYRKHFKTDQRGMVGITLDSRFYFAKNPVDTHAVDHAMNFELGWFANPIFSKKGGYPQVMVDEINERSEKEGRPFSRLPEMSKEMREFIRGSADFLGFNYYSSRYVELNTSEYDPTSQPTIYQDSRVVTSIDPSWKRAKSEWLYSVPQGLHDALVWIKDNYNNPIVIITENGWSDSGELDDTDRIDYFRDHLIAVAKAVNIEKCNVIGYTAWSIIDNFEWRRGYAERFGIYNINITSPNKERTAKKSAKFFNEIIKTKTVHD